MTPELWQRVSGIFHGAVAQAPTARAAFLDEQCAAEPELRAAVERLLVAHDKAGRFGEIPIFSPGHAAQATGAAELAPAEDQVSSDGAGSDSAGPAVARRHFFFWVAALAAVVTSGVLANAVWQLVVGLPESPALGWVQNARGGQLYVGFVDPAGPVADELRVGDRIVRLNDVAGVARGGLGAARRDLAIGESYELVIERDGQQLEFRLPVGGVAPQGALAYFIIGFTWCVIGLGIGLARPQNPLARLACLTSLATGFVFMQGIFIRVGPLWQPLHAVLGYHFLARFPTGNPTRGIWRGALVFMYVFGGLAVAIGQLLGQTVRLDGSASAVALIERLPGVNSLAQWAGLAAYTAAIFGMPIVLAYNYRKLTDDDQRRRVRWVLWAGVVGLAPQLWWAVANAAESLLGPMRLPRFDVFANLATLGMPLAMAYAVVRHRVLDIRVVIRRGVQYLLARRALQAAVLLPFAALLYIVASNRELTVAQLVTETGGYLFWLALAGVALRFRRPIQLWLDRRFFRQEYDREQLMEKLLDESRRVDSLAELSEIVGDTLVGALHPQSAAVWYRDPRERADTATSRPAPRDFPADERWLSWLEQRATLTSLPLPPDAGLSNDDLRRLERRGIEAIVPIADSGDRLVGALLLGPKRSEEAYSEGDSRFLNAVAKQTAVIRENLRLRKQLSEEVRVRHDVLARLDERLPDLLKECPACGACYSGEITSCTSDGTTLVLTLPIARTVDARYRLDRVLGKGGMGAVYEARDLRLDRVVAVKIMLSRAFGQAGSLRRFRREARTAAGLSHPCIVAVHDVGSFEGEGAYIVMERVQGETLRAVLAREGTLAPAAAAEWFEPLLSGIAAAHERGIVHRDLKPENVMGNRGDSGALAVKILDLGLVKLREGEANVSGTMTQDGAILGTPDYMSPEQLLGRDVDHRSDLFSIGVMLLETLTGEKTASEATPQTIVANDLHELVCRCLAADPRDRPGSAIALREQLLPLLRREALPA
jgi:eukaryotic-like serine/threonine-protein kinase